MLLHGKTNENRIFSLCPKSKRFLGSTEIWTRIAGFRVLSANHYTIQPVVEQRPIEAKLIWRNGSGKSCPLEIYHLTSLETTISKILTRYGRSHLGLGLRLRTRLSLCLSLSPLSLSLWPFDLLRNNHVQNPDQKWEEMRIRLASYINIWLCQENA